MTAPHYEAERCIQSHKTRTRTPLFLAGAFICYALAGVIALAMLSESRTPGPIFVCGIGEPPIHATVSHLTLPPPAEAPPLG